MTRVKACALALLGVAPLEARDPLEHQLRDGSVLANHDEDRRYLDACLLPALILAFVVAIERIEGCAELVRQVEWAQLVGAGRSLGKRFVNVLL